MATQYDECLINGMNIEEKLHFNHVCTHIVLKFKSNEIDNLSFDLDDEMLHVSNSCITKYNDCYIIPLIKSMTEKSLRQYGINFGSIKKQLINIKFKEPIVIVQVL